MNGSYGALFVLINHNISGYYSPAQLPAGRLTRDIAFFMGCGAMRLYGF